MLERLKRPIYYKVYLGNADSYDDDGNFIGAIPSYSEAKSERFGVSAAKGGAESEIFGNLLDYDRTLTTRNIMCEMQENSVVWLDGADIETEPYNYIVVRKSVTNNFAVFALKRVEVTKNA